MKTANFNHTNPVYAFIEWGRLTGSSSQLAFECWANFKEVQGRLKRRKANMQMDLLRFNPKNGEFIEYEFKKSYSDFLNDFTSKKKHQQVYHTQEPVDFLRANKFYFVIPNTILGQVTAYLNTKPQYQKYGVIVYRLGTSDNIIKTLTDWQGSEKGTYPCDFTIHTRSSLFKTPDHHKMKLYECLIASMGKNTDYLLRKIKTLQDLDVRQKGTKGKW